MPLHKLLGQWKADPYLIFNGRREAMCGAHGCDHRARDIEGISREAKDASVAGSRPHIKVGDHYLWFGRALCGTHNRSHRLGMWMQATLMTGYIDLDFDLLARAFSEKEERDRLRHERQEADYRSDRLKVARTTDEDFNIVQENDHRSGKRWVINGRDYGGGWAPCSWVTLVNDHDVWSITNGDYAGHTGKGRGSPALARIVARLIAEAADIADERNKEVK
jgi:hypothetical protein